MPTFPQLRPGQFSAMLKRDETPSLLCAGGAGGVGWWLPRRAARGRARAGERRKRACRRRGAPGGWVGGSWVGGSRAFSRRRAPRALGGAAGGGLLLGHAGAAPQAA